MKPQDLYRGPAPAAMGQMGAGLNEVGANIARSTLAGYEALGKGLASGIEQGAGAFVDAMKMKKKLESQNKADRSFFESMYPLLPENVRDTVKADFQKLEADPKTSPYDIAAYHNTLKSTIGTLVAANESAAKIEQYKAEAAYKNAASKLKAAPVPDFSSLFPPSLGGGTKPVETPSASGASSEGLVSPFVDDYTSNSEPKVPWQDAKSKINFGKIGGPKWWDSLPSARQQSMIKEWGP